MSENVNTISRITVGGTTYELKSNVVPKIVTWEELKKLKDSNELSPGLKYRITDYIATVSSNNPNALSTGIGFDIIVEALTTSKLNEIVQACYYSRGDNEVFENCNLNAWKIRYCFDNDTSRFAWADSKNGKGVIYWMEDEWGNVTNYDFKGIKLNNKYTFGNINQDYSLNGSCSGNKIGINKDNNGYLTSINLGANSKNNNIGNNCSDINLTTANNVNIGNNCSDITFTTIEGTTVGNNCKDLNISKCINSCIGNNVSNIRFNTGEYGIENLTICDNNSNITINLKKNNESAKNLKILEGTTGSSEGWIINDLETSSDFLTVIEKRKDNNGEYRIYRDPYLEIKEEIDTKYDESNLFQTVELDLKDYEWVTLPREIKVGSIVTINLIKSTSPNIPDRDKTNPLDFRIYAALGYSSLTNLNYSQSASKTFLVTKDMIKDGVSTKSIQMYTGSTKTESTAKIQIIYHDELRKYIDEVLDRPQVIYTDLNVRNDDSCDSYMFDRAFREYDYVRVSILNTGSELTTILGNDNKLYLYSDDITENGGHGAFTAENKTIYLKKAGTRIWCWRSGLTNDLKDSNITIQLSITIPNRDRTSSYSKYGTKRSLTGENIWLGNFDDFNKLQEILDNFWYTETDNNTALIKGSCVGSFGASIGNREYIQIYSTTTYINGGHWQQVMSGFFSIENDKSIKSSSTKFSIIYRNRTSKDINTKWSDWKYLDDELNTKITNEITRVNERIQGISDNSNPSTDPFRKLITVGDINSEDDEGNNKVLKALDALHSTSVSDNLAGRWRVIASNNAYDVENVVLHYISDKWLQIFHGPFRISNNSFSFDSYDYRISWRKYENGVWSDWYCREDDFSNKLMGKGDIEPKEYPFKYLGTFDTLDSLIAKLDTLAIITTDSPNTKLVGSFRAIRDQKIYTIYNDCASWSGVFVQTIMGCLTVGDEGKLVSSDFSWGIYRRTSSNDGGKIKWGNWIPVADSNKLSNIEKNSSAISAEAARAQAAEKALSERIDNIPTGGGGNDYILPIATTDILGGIKSSNICGRLGDNPYGEEFALNVLVDGKASVTIPKADNSGNFGIVKVDPQNTCISIDETSGNLNIDDATTLQAGVLRLGTVAHGGEFLPLAGGNNKSFAGINLGNGLLNTSGILGLKHEIVDFTWDANSNINDFKEPGFYKIYGERVNTNDNLPINNSNPGHSIAAILNVVDSSLRKSDGTNPSEKCITQFLQLSNRLGNEGKSYIRTYNENNGTKDGWSAWKTVQSIVEDYLGNRVCSDTKHYIFANNNLSEITDDDNSKGLNGFIDNGNYAGVYCQNLEDIISNAISSGLTSPDQILGYIVQNASFETYNLVVINDYSLAGLLGKERHVTQIKTSIITSNGRAIVKKRVGTGNSSLVWTDWEDTCDAIYDLGVFSQLGDFEIAAIKLWDNPRVLTITGLIKNDWQNNTYRATINQKFILSNTTDVEDLSITETHQILYYLGGNVVRRIVGGIVQGSWAPNYLNNIRDITSFTSKNAIEICQVTSNYCSNSDKRGSYNKSNNNIDTLVTLNVATTTSPGLMSADNYDDLIEASNFLSKLKTEFGTNDLDAIVSKLASLK